MNNIDRIETVAPAIAAFAERMGLTHEDPETIVGDMLCNLLHWVQHKTGDRKDGLRAARFGIAHFITESGIDYADPEADEVGPESYVAITVECDGEQWHSTTGGGESILGARAKREG